MDLLNGNTWNHLTVCKQITFFFFFFFFFFSSFQENKITSKLFTYRSYVYPFSFVQTNDWS